MSKVFFQILLVLSLVALGLQFLPRSEAHSKTTIVQHTEAADPDASGFWKKQTIWKSRWVKYWRAKVTYVPVWKKVWSPVIQNEWVPLPKAPAGWEKSDDGRSHVRESSWR